MVSSVSTYYQHVITMNVQFDHVAEVVSVSNCKVTLSPYFSLHTLSEGSHSAASDT